MPGAHHIEARVFKDVFPRFRTMQGYHVARKAGWDCHGLPVELAVEKELGFTGKQDIEAYGIAEFNAKLPRVGDPPHRRVRRADRRAWATGSTSTTRTGRWTPTYIESVWWSLKQIFDKGLLVQDYRVAPWCPRCGTGLSDHELAQGYENVVDPSVYVRFPLTSGPLAGEASLLVWTTTPWTLVSNTAVAVHPDVTYVVATDGNEKLVVAEPLLEQALGEGWEATGESFTGAEMERWTYQRPFDLVEFPADAHFVVLADYVTTEDGTGLVHQAPAFGADDLAGLPRVRPAGGQPGPPGRHLRAGRCRWSAASSSRRPTRRSSRTSTRAACSSGTSRTSTATRTAGAATPRCSTTRSRPGTSAPPRSRTRCSRENEQHQLVPGRRSSTAGTATG